MTPAMDAGVAPIGWVHSCFPEKFGVPRQPGLAPAAVGTIRLIPPYDIPEMVRGLDAFSHVWVLFRFHGCSEKPWRPTVRPPRLGGNRRVGVLATRSGFRPNGIGMSAVRLAGVHCGKNGVFLAVAGIDMIDGTPVLDIKPYLPYSDAVPAAKAPPRPAAAAVEFSAEAETVLDRLETDRYEGLRNLLAEVLAQDPRPAYDGPRRRAKTYGMRIYDLNVRWEAAGAGIKVVDIARNDDGRPLATRCRG